MAPSASIFARSFVSWIFWSSILVLLSRTDNRSFAMICFSAAESVVLDCRLAIAVRTALSAVAIAAWVCVCLSVTESVVSACMRASRSRNTFSEEAIAACDIVCLSVTDSVVLACNRARVSLTLLSSSARYFWVAACLSAIENWAFAWIVASPACSVLCSFCRAAVFLAWASCPRAAAPVAALNWLVFVPSCAFRPEAVFSPAALNSAARFCAVTVLVLAAANVLASCCAIGRAASYNADCPAPTAMLELRRPRSFIFWAERETACRMRGESAAMMPPMRPSTV